MTFLNAPIKNIFVLDSKPNFNVHVDQKIKKCSRIIGLIIRLSISLPRNALLTIYKSFVRPYLDYDYILYDKPNNDNFQNKLEKVSITRLLLLMFGFSFSNKLI